MRYVTRFAPSPTGYLHLGHAFSALTAAARARQNGGTFRLRIEDIDTARARPAFERAIFEDLGWLGLGWPEPVLRQSARLPAYRAALARLVRLGVCYPCRCTRRDIRAALAAPQEGGATTPVYPGTCRGRDMSEAGPGDAIRLDMRRALAALGGAPAFEELGPLRRGRRTPDPARLIAETGDIVLARRDIGTSYHLSVVVDDADEGITEIVRGSDLFDATPVHRILQALLELPAPRYWHHAIIRNDTGRRLAKRDDARAIRRYRAGGADPQDVAHMVGLSLPA